MKRTIIFVLAMVCLLLSGCKADKLQVKDVWARPGLAGENSAIYLVIDNPGQADKLLSASTEAAEVAQLHLSKMTGEGMMTMEEQMSIEAPAGGKVELKPGGLHIMLIGLKNDLKPGDSLPVILKFEKAGEIALTATVKEP